MAPFGVGGVRETEAEGAGGEGAAAGGGGAVGREGRGVVWGVLETGGVWSYEGSTLELGERIPMIYVWDMFADGLSRCTVVRLMKLFELVEVVHWMLSSGTGGFYGHDWYGFTMGYTRECVNRAGSSWSH